MGTHCTAGMILFMCFPETKHILVKAPFHDSKNPLCKYLLQKFLRLVTSCIPPICYYLFLPKYVTFFFLALQPKDHFFMNQRTIGSHGDYTDDSSSQAESQTDSSSQYDSQTDLSQDETPPHADTINTGVLQLSDSDDDQVFNDGIGSSATTSTPAPPTSTRPGRTYRRARRRRTSSGVSGLADGMADMGFEHAELIRGRCTLPITLVSLSNPSTFCWFISFILTFCVAYKDLSRVQPIVQRLRYAPVRYGGPGRPSAFVMTLIDLVNTHFHVVYDMADTRRFLEQFLAAFVTSEQDKQIYRTQHMFAETAYHHIEGVEFFRDMQITTRNRVTRQNCNKKCIDIDESDTRLQKKYDIPIVFSEPRHHAAYPIPLPGPDEFLEDIFLGNFINPVHYNKVCKTCQTRTFTDMKRQQILENVVRFPNAFVITLNRVYWSQTIPPARLKNARRVKLRETMDIPQPDANLAPITYRYIKNMLLYQNHFR